MQIEFTCTLDAEGRMPKTRATFLRRQMQLRAGKETRFCMGDPIRTGAQNRYYHGYLVRPTSLQLIDAGYMFERVLPTGETVPESPTHGRVHDYFKAYGLGIGIVTVRGVDTIVPATTTELAVDEFLDYCERCRTSPLVEEAGIYLPEPGEAGFTKPFRSGKIAEPSW
ncbi:MAG TPA: hypothetical protein VD838_01415 [Anaeromyxobacteraceae bacterium]|nr:hypothetical protein [Anaeromyxobacteraceae bacterium]